MTIVGGHCEQHTVLLTTECKKDSDTENHDMVRLQAITVTYTRRRLPIIEHYEQRQYQFEVRYDDL